MAKSIWCVISIQKDPNVVCFARLFIRADSYRDYEIIQERDLHKCSGALPIHGNVILHGGSIEKGIARF